jgi:hypothetical protein
MCEYDDTTVDDVPEISASGGTGVDVGVHEQQLNHGLEKATLHLVHDVNRTTAVGVEEGVLVQDIVDGVHGKSMEKSFGSRSVASHLRACDRVYGRME